ncbi:MAG: ABC transporter ATP-binding protein [Candidatus Rhabdochlamydia sp.]
MDKREGVILQNVSKTFTQGGESLHVLKSVDFHAKQGETVMIAGPSGSGKTTLLSTVAGTLKADHGRIQLFDFELHKNKEKDVLNFRRQHIGFIFQQFNLIPTLTCQENVAIPLLLQGVSYHNALKEAVKGLDDVGLSAKIYHHPQKLSGGQQQRVAIARALIHKPSLIICDEPTSALDAESGMKIMELIKGHTVGSGKIVIVVTHDSRIFKFATRIVHMDDGQIVEEKEGFNEHLFS